MRRPWHSPQLSVQLSDIQINIAEQHGRYGLTLEFALQSLHIGHEQFGPGALSLSLAGLDGQTLVALATTTDVAEGLLLVQQLLHQKPQLRVQHLQLATARGELSLQADATLQRFNLLQLFNPLALMLNALQQGQAQIAITQSLLEWAAPLQFESWRTAGLIRLEQGVYHCQIHLHNGRLLINGTEIPLS